MIKTGSLLLAILLMVIGCQTRASMTATATVEGMEGNQFMVSLDIQRGTETIASPKVLCLAGEKATIELADGDESITIEVHTPAAGDIDPVFIDIQFVEPGFQAVTQHIEVSTETPQLSLGGAN